MLELAGKILNAAIDICSVSVQIGIWVKNVNYKKNWDSKTKLYKSWN